MGFKTNDLVWAKLKGVPLWPGKIQDPPRTPKAPSASSHYVMLFGSETRHWVAEDCLIHHSSEQLQNRPRTATATYDTAVKEIIAESASRAGTSTDRVAAAAPPKSNTSSSEKPTTTSSSKKSTTTSSSGSVGDEFVDMEVGTVAAAALEEPKQKKQKKPPVGITEPRPCGTLEDFIFLPPGTGVSRDYVPLPDRPPLNIDVPNPDVMLKAVVATKKKIGFIGMGLVGRYILKNLLHTGHDVTVWNQSPGRCREFMRLGARQVSSPGELVRSCDITFCCLSNADHALKVFYGNHNVMKEFATGGCEKKGYVEMTTMDPDKIKEMGHEVTRFGGRYLEAVFRGSREKAESGSLVISSSGDQSLFDELQSCFDAIAKKALFVGPELGDSSKMNVILNMLDGVTSMALAQSIALMERSKTEAGGYFMDILRKCPFQLPGQAKNAQHMLDRDYATDTSLKYQHESMQLALKLGSACGQPMTVTASSNEVLKHAKCIKYGEHDVTAVVEASRYR